MGAVQEAKLEAPAPVDGGAAGDHFGTAVALSGDTALVSAPDGDTAAGNNAGSAYIFVRSGTTWSQQTQLLASDGAANDGFGSAVALDGDVAVVGAPSEDEPSIGQDTGVVYVFTRYEGQWRQQDRLFGSSSVSDSFGQGVAVDGRTIIVGAPGVDNSGADSGLASVFLEGEGSWFLQSELTPGLPASGISCYGFGRTRVTATAV